MTAQDYLRRVLNARVYDVAIETALDHAPTLSERLGNRVLLKREDLQPVFSFKLRGAYNRMVKLDAAERRRGVIAASAGNHAQGVALAAQRLHCRAVIVMPVTTPQVKVDAVRSRGAQVELHGDSYSDAYARATQLQARHRLTFVHPFDDPDVIAGQGTVAMEILRQHHPDGTGPIHAIFVPIGGGGLISGVATYVKAVQPQIRVIGVQTADSDAMARSLQAGRRVHAARRGPVLGRDRGAAGRRGDLPPVPAARRRYRHGRHRRAVRRDQGRVPGHARPCWSRPARWRWPAARRTWNASGCEGQTLVAIASGANMNFDRLRFVAERAEVGERREAVFAVTIPEERGVVQALLRAGRQAQRDRVQLPDRRPAGRPHLRRRAACAAQRGRQAREGVPARRVRRARPDRRRAGQGAPAPHGRRPFAAGQGRAAVPVRVSGAARRADAVPQLDVARTGTSRCSTIATRVPTTAASWSDCRCRAEKKARSSASCPRSATPARTRPRTRPTGCF